MPSYLCATRNVRIFGGELSNMPAIFCSLTEAHLHVHAAHDLWAVQHQDAFDDEDIGGVNTPCLGSTSMCREVIDRHVV